jgi:hypothetical protein
MSAFDDSCGKTFSSKIISIWFVERFNEWRFTIEDQHYCWNRILQCHVPEIFVASLVPEDRLGLLSGAELISKAKVGDWVIFTTYCRDMVKTFRFGGS